MSARGCARSRAPVAAFVTAAERFYQTMCMLPEPDIRLALVARHKMAKELAAK